LNLTIYRLEDGIKEVLEDNLNKNTYSSFKLIIDESIGLCFIV